MDIRYSTYLRVVAGIVAVVALCLLDACQEHRLAPDTGVLPDATIYALNDANQLLKINVRTANSPQSVLVITGVNFPAGERMVSIDFRPATGQLYGVSNMSRLFVINPATAEARPLTATPFKPGIAGTVIGMDFNPTTDRIRLVSSNGQALRLNPETGLVVATDGSIHGVSGVMISEVAYTNNQAGETTTTLYDIDPATDRLYSQNSLNNSTLTDVGALGLDIAGAAGFDISPGDNTQGLVAVTFNGSSELEQINLLTGRLQKLSNLPGTIIGLAIPTNPVAYAIDSTNNLLIFNPQSPVPIAKTIANLQPGETIYGIDVRPANGRLYVLGSSSRLYTLGVAASGVWTATAVGKAGAFKLLGADFDVKFDPAADQIRVVSYAGQTLLLNPTDGVPVVTEALVDKTSPKVTATAYTGNFAGTASTNVYHIDTRSGRAVLVQQNSSRAEAPTAVGPLGIEIEGVNGFAVGGTSGTAYALLRTGGNSTKVYTINLTTGAATAGPELPGNPTIRGFTVGLGF